MSWLALHEIEKCGGGGKRLKVCLNRASLDTQRHHSGLLGRK